MEGLPSDARRIRDPVLVGVCMAAGGAGLFDQRLVGSRELGPHRGQFLRGFHLNPEVIDAGLTAALRNREIDSRVFKHPLSVVVLSNHWLRLEERAVETDAVG